MRSTCLVAVLWLALCSLASADSWGASWGGDPSLQGLTSFANANAYQTVSGDGEQGSASGFTVALLMSVDSQSGVSQGRWVTGVSDATAPSYGWSITTQAKNSAVQFAIRHPNGSGISVSAPAFAVGPAMVGKILHVVGVVDTTALTISLYVDGVLVAVPTTITGYVVPDTAAPDTIGRLAIGASGTIGADGVTVYGRATGHGVMTQVEIAAHRAACRREGDIVPLSGASIAATYTHSVRASSSGSAPTSLVDTTGSAVMTKSGSPTWTTKQTPRWRLIDQPPTGAEVWLVIGESYARGAADDPVNIPAGFPSDRVWMVTGEPAIVPLSEPTGIYTLTGPGLSPGGALVWLRRVATGRPQILVNAGRGGTRTDQWLPSANAGWIEKAIASANWAIARSGGTLKGIVWLQGVNDAVAGISTYAANTAIVESTLRTQVTGAANVPFVITRLQPTTVTGASQPNWDVQRAAQAGYTGVNRYIAEIPTGTMTADTLHPETLLNLAIGQNILDVVAQALP